MFGVNKRTFLALMIGFLASSFLGCSTIISHSGHFASELDSPQTRVEVREKFGEPDEIKTCPGGNVIESLWIRQKIPDFSYLGFLGPGGFLLEIVLFPVAAQRSEEAKFHYAFVYDEAGRVLYRYDLKDPLIKQFNHSIRPLDDELVKQLKGKKCDPWSTCIADYIREARQRANCIEYSLSAEEEQGFEDLLTISGWVDSGQVLREEGLTDIKEILQYRYWSVF